MPVKRITITPGEREQTIDRIPLARREQEREPEAAERERARRAAPPDSDEPELIVPRSQLTVLFYDLAMRLRSRVGPLIADTASERAFIAAADQSAPAIGDELFNEYAPVEYEIAGTYLETLVSGVAYHIPRAEVLALDRRLLAEVDHAAFNPFGLTPANKSLRALPNVMQLPYRISASSFWVRLGEEHLEVGRKEGDDPEDAEVNWKRRKPSPDDEVEQWNPFNVADGASFEPGYLTAKKVARLDRVAITPPPLHVGDQPQHWPLYYYFDTGDVAKFKVTSEPTFEAEEVALSFSRSRPLHVYLKPVLFVSDIRFRAYDQFGNSRELTEHSFIPSVGVWFGGRVAAFPSIPRKDGEQTNAPPYARSHGANFMRMPIVREGFVRVLAEYRASPFITGGGIIILPGQQMTDVSFTQSLPNGIQHDGLPFFDTTGTLCGVLRQQSKKFYVWFRRDLTVAQLRELGGTTGNTDVTPSGLIT